MTLLRYQRSRFVQGSRIRRGVTRRRLAFRRRKRSHSPFNLQLRQNSLHPRRHNGAYFSFIMVTQWCDPLSKINKLFELELVRSSFCNFTEEKCSSKCLKRKKASLYEERLNLTLPRGDSRGTQSPTATLLFCEYRKREGLSLSEAASRYMRIKRSRRER